MTMPLQFNKAEYIDILERGGVAPDLALVYADAIEAGLQQHVMLVLSLILHAITLTKLFF